MAKRYIVKINYESYIASDDDIARLFEVAAKFRKVETVGYRPPYYYSAKDWDLIDEVVLVDFEPTFVPTADGTETIQPAAPDDDSLPF